MNRIIQLLYLFLLTAKIRTFALDEAESILSESLQSYKIIKNVKNTNKDKNLTIRMNTEIGEHLMDINLSEMKEEKIKLNFYNAKSKNLEKNFVYNSDTFKLQKSHFFELFKRMVVTPGEDVIFNTIEELKAMIKNMMPNLNYEEKNKDQSSSLIVSSEESIISVFEFFLSSEKKNEINTDYFIHIRANSSFNNEIVYHEEKISVFETVNFSVKMKEFFNLNTFVNNKEEVLNVFKQIFTKDEFVFKDIKKTKEEKSVVISLQNSHVLAKLVYLPQNDSVGDYSLKLYAVSEMGQNELKIDENQTLENFTFKRMSKSALLEIFKNIDLDNLFKTIHGEIIKMYLENYEQIYKPVFLKHSNIEEKENFKTGMNLGIINNQSNNIKRSVKAWDENKKGFVALFYVLISDKNIKIVFQNSIVDNNYELNITEQTYRPQTIDSFIKMVLKSNVNYKK
jgi:hypothetical protein